MFDVGEMGHGDIPVLKELLQSIIHVFIDILDSRTQRGAYRPSGDVKGVKIHPPPNIKPACPRG